MPVLYEDLAWVLNEIWIIDLSSALVGMLMSELYCVVLIKHVAFFTIWPKLTVAFTCTSLPLNLNTFDCGCGCGFGFEQNV